MRIGFNIVKRALEEPVRQIASNAGREGSIVIEEVKEMKQDIGFNALNEEFPGGIESHRVMLEKEGFKTRPFVLR